jgi:hypothetical protein
MRPGIPCKVLLGLATVSVSSVVILPGDAWATSEAKIVHTSHFAGFEVTDVNPTTEASTSFSVPAAACASTPSGAFAFVGLNNGTTNNFTDAGVGMNCNAGVSSYYAATDVNNTFYTSPQQIAAGDSVVVTVNASGTGTTATVADHTNGSSTTVTVSGPGGAGSFNTVAAGLEGVGAASNPPPPLGSISFTATRVNGAAFGSAGPFGRYEWFHKTVLVAATSPLSAGTSFTVTVQ